MGGAANQSLINQSAYKYCSLLLFNCDLCNTSFRDQSIYEKFISFLINITCNYKVKKSNSFFAKIFKEYYKIDF